MTNLDQNVFNFAEKEKGGLQRFGLPENLKKIPNNTKIFIRLTDIGAESMTPKIFNTAISAMRDVDYSQALMVSYPIPLSNENAIFEFHKALETSKRIIGVIEPANIKETLIIKPRLAALFGERVLIDARLAIDPVLIKKGRLYAINNMGISFARVLKRDLGNNLKGKKTLIELAKANGKSIALALAREGAQVTIFDADQRDLNQLKRFFKNMNLQIHALHADKDLDELERQAAHSEIFIEAQEHVGEWKNLNKLAALMPDSIIKNLANPKALHSYTLAFGNDITPNMSQILSFRQSLGKQTYNHMGNDYVEQINCDHFESIMGALGLISETQRDHRRNAWRQ